MTTIILAALLGFAGGCLFGWYWSNKTVKLALKISREFAKAHGEELPAATIVADESDAEQDNETKSMPIPKDGDLLIDYDGKV